MKGGFLLSYPMYYLFYLIRPSKFFHTIKNFFVFAILLIPACTANEHLPYKIKQTRLLMDTFVEITVIHNDKKVAQKAIDAAFDAIKGTENLMSRHMSNSDISLLNQNAGNGFQKIDRDVYEVINRSVYYSKLSRGKFDITVGILMDRLWKFDNKNKALPTDNEIKKLLSLVNYRNIIFKGNDMISLDIKGMMIDVGGIGKGYAVDKGMEALKSMGIQNAVINAGGDLKAIGARESDKPWRIGVQHPRAPSEILGVMEVNDIAIATSGDYQKYFEKNGRRYHHILDPETGCPANGIQSVTITAKDVMDADAIATTVFVIGPEDGMKFIENTKDVEGLIITSEGERIISSGLKIEFEQ